MRRLTLPLTSLLALLATASPAAAECAAATAFAAPSDATALPPNPTLWIFAPRWEDDSVEASAPMRRGELESFGDVGVRAVRFEISAGTLDVRVGDREYHYRIDPAWSRGEAGPTLGPPRDIASAWTCSYTDVVELRVESTAAAFEVSWQGGRTVVPAHAERFWGEGYPRDAAIQLGHVSCLGRTTDLRGRPRADVLHVTALYPDGSRANANVDRPPVSQLELPRTERSAPRSVPLAMGSTQSPWPLAGAGLLLVLLIPWLVHRGRARLRRLP